MTKSLTPILGLAAVLMVATGCTQTERTLAGAGIGGAGGALAGNAIGGRGGAVGGALLGGTAGAIVGRGTY